MPHLLLEEKYGLPLQLFAAEFLRMLAHQKRTKYLNKHFFCRKSAIICEVYICLHLMTRTTSSKNIPDIKWVSCQPLGNLPFLQKWL